MRSSEFLTYVLFIVGFVLFNFLIQRTARRARQRQEQEAAQQQEAARRQQGAQRQEESAPPPEEEPLENVWGRQRQAEAPTAAVPVAPTRRVEASQPAPARTGPRALFGSRRELRHAIVVMTVLGPCRALEPHDRGQAWQAMGGPPARS